MTRSYILPALFLLILTTAACDSNGPDADSRYEVTYTVEATGEGTITSLSYRDGSGALFTVEHPVLPWSRNVSMHSGDRAWFSIDGTVLSGSFELSLQAVNDDTVIDLNTGCATGSDEVYPATCTGVTVERRLP